MAKSDPTKAGKPCKLSEVELEPDAWPRFEQFRNIAKAGPRGERKS